jgi:gluconolactonase
MALLNNDTDVSVLVDGLDHVEGVAWGLDGYCYAGGEAGQIYRVDIEQGTATQIADTGGFILGLALDANHNIYACDTGNRAVMKITPDCSVSEYATGATDEPFHTPNYPAFDADGNLYVCDSGDWKSDNGKIFKVKPGGDTQVWTQALCEFPNGLCVGPNGSSLFVAMSLNPPRVAEIQIAPDGSAGDIRTVVELPGAVPDGVAFDTDGNLYIACYRPDRIYRFSSAGKLEALADDFEGTIIAAPTNIAFCGTDRDILLSANLGRWHITRYETGANGIALHYPDLG